MKIIKYIEFQTEKKETKKRYSEKKETKKKLKIKFFSYSIMIII